VRIFFLTQERNRSRSCKDLSLSYGRAQTTMSLCGSTCTKYSISCYSNKIIGLLLLCFIVKLGNCSLFNTLLIVNDYYQYNEYNHSIIAIQNRLKDSNINVTIWTIQETLQNHAKLKRNFEAIIICADDNISKFIH
jgi:hypothetical protein